MFRCRRYSQSEESDSISTFSKRTKCCNWKSKFFSVGRFQISSKSNFRLSHFFHFDRDIKNNVSSDLKYPVLAGIDKRLEVKLKKGKHFRILKCLHNGFVVHSPLEHPLRFNDVNFCELGYGKNYEVLIEPEVITSDEYLLTHYTKQQRYCIFQGEIQLTYFKSYTQKNCEMECLAELVIKECGCVPFYFLSNGTTPVCSNQWMMCVGWTEFKVHQKFPGYDLVELCGCLPPCNSIKYNFEIIVNKLQNVSDREAAITFKFKDSYCTAFRRYQQFTLLEFASEAGGILGLLAGSSLLSIIEVFYFLVIRSSSNLVRYFVVRFSSLRTTPA